MTVDGTEFLLTFGGHLITQDGDASFPPTYQVSRALLEGRLLERLRACPDVDVREGYDVGLAADTAVDRPASSGAGGHGQVIRTGSR